MAPISPDHKSRIHQELIRAGLTHYALLKMESRYLPKIIDSDETIGAAVYGRKPKQGGGMLIATNKRVIFLDRKPLFVTFDELSYHIVSGVKINNQGLLTVLSLHTRLGDYILRTTNVRSADKFAKFIEKIAIDKPESKKQLNILKNSKLKATSINGEAVGFLNRHEVAVISSVDRTGNVQGAAVYYLVHNSSSIYIVTKAATNKAQNLLDNSQVALTVYDEEKLEIAQIQGWAEAETDQVLINSIFPKLIKPRSYEGEERLPPISQINAGQYVVIRITPTLVHYSSYK